MSKDSFSQDALKIQIGLLAIAIISLVASFNLEWKLWGLDALVSFPTALRIALVLILGAVMLPQVQSRISHVMSKKASVKKIAITYAVSSIAILGFFMFLRSNNHLLGDGHMVLSNLASGKSVPLFELLTNAAHRAVFALTQGGDAGASLTFRLVAYASGAIFLFGLWFFLKNKAEVWIALASVLTFAVMQLFAGYVERYTLSFLCAFLYVMSAHRDLREKRVSPLTIVALLLAIAFHLEMGVLSLSLIYLIYKRRRSKTILIACVAIGLVMLIAAIIYSSEVTSLERVFVPLWANSFTPYALFTPQHLGDLLNLALLNFPLLLVMILTKFFWKMRFGLFNLLTIVPTLSFMILVDPKLGAIRDWDLLSVASAPIMAAIINSFISLEQEKKLLLWRVTIPLFLFALIHTGSFIWGNTSLMRPYPRIKAVIQDDLHYSAQYDKGHRNRPWAQTVRTIYNDRDEVMRTLKLTVDADPEDYGARYLLAMSYSTYRNDSTTAAQLVSDHWQGLLIDPTVTANIGRMLFRVGDREQVEKVFDSYVEGGGRDTLICYNLLALKDQRGDKEEAWKLYKLILDSQKNPTIERRLNFALYSLRHGHLAEGESVLRAVQPALPPLDQAGYAKILEAAPRHNQAEIDSLLDALGRALQ